MDKKFSISDLSLKRRVWIAVSLVSLIPLIILFCYINGYYVSLIAKSSLVLVVFLGWWIVFEVFSSIVKVYSHSRETLENIGEKSPAISDEVKNLDAVIDLLSEKVRNGFEELKDFTQKTELLNKEVSRKVLILSTILQANDLFSKDAPAEEVIKFLNSHLEKLLEFEVSFCCLRDDFMSNLRIISSSGIDFSKIDNFIIDKEKTFTKVKDIVIMDSAKKHKNYLSWPEELGTKNLAVAPVISKGQLIGLVAGGNSKISFSFTQDDLDVLNLFSQNVALIWEHARLMSKIDELEILDYLTGLYNEKAVTKRLNEEIRRATTYQRPCGFITLKIVNYEKYMKDAGLIEAERVLKNAAKSLKTVLRPIDLGGRIGPDTLGAILIERNKRQSQVVADNLKKVLEKVCPEGIKISFAIAESPVNGITAKELMSFAKNQSVS